MPLLQVPHKRLRFGGGATSSADGCVGQAGVPGALPGLGTSDQVVSLSLSGKNGRMLSYRYHCLSAKRDLSEEQLKAASLDLVTSMVMTSSD